MSRPSDLDAPPVPEASMATILPSRARVLDAFRAALDKGPGLLLLTGEPGSGKTWACRRIAAERVGGLDWLAVDLAPTDGPHDLARTIAAALGWPSASARDASWPLVAETLAELADEPRRLGLIVDEAQNGVPETLEAVRLLTNRLGRPDGFGAILLCGQSGLLGRLRSRPLRALDARIDRRRHLGPIDLEEATALLGSLPGRWSASASTECYRWSLGNPRRLLRLAPDLASGEAPTPAPPAIATPPAPRIAVDAPAMPASPTGPEPLVASRPPLALNDGMIEVGWDPRQEAASSDEPVATDAPGTPAEVAVDDPYTTMQAWEEWTRNRDQVAPDSDADSMAGRVWSEPRQGFSPYGDLFALAPAAGEGESRPE